MDRKIILDYFEEYVSNYDLSDPNIFLKYVHTKKVAENCENIAKAIGMSECEADLAWEMGMLHDIGRFEQLKQYHTYNDAVSIDHAQFGADLLFNDCLMEKFDSYRENWEIVEKAIRCHSLYRLPENLTIREKTFCDILRDADKIDIFRANYETGIPVVYGVTVEELENSFITAEVYDVFMEERAIPRNIKKTIADHVVGHLALNFELVYPISRQIADEQGFVWKLLEVKFKNPDTIEKMRNISNKIRGLFGYR